MKTSAMGYPGYIVAPHHGPSRNRLRSRVRAYDIGAIFAFAVALQALLIFVSISFGAEGSSSFSRGADFLTCSYQPASTEVPMVTLHDGHAAVRTLGIRWNPSADPANAPVVSISMQGDAPQNGAIRAQSWMAALSAAFAWQNPWQGAAWVIDAGSVTAFDGTGATAPLAVAMIASAAGIAYPADTAVIADLNPDGTLAPVPQIADRLAAASKAGLKRVVIPAVQRFNYAGPAAEGQISDLVAVASRLGLECLPADTLAEAAEKVLGRSLPPMADTGSTPRLDPALYSRLEGECKTQLAALQATRAQWPLAVEQQASLPLWQRALWSEAAVRFESGVADLRGGKVYAARGELGEANALVYALNSLRGGVPPVAQLQAEARELKTSYRAALAKVSDGRDDLQSGLAAAEMADWVDGVTAQIEGAENLVSQASSARSQALPEQKRMAEAQLAVAVKKAEAQQERLASFAALSRESAAHGEVPVFDRAGLWLPQLVPAHLALGESFVLRLQKADDSLARNLIYDARLTAQTRLLRDQKAVWDNRESVRQASAAAPEGAVQTVGFFPGDAYRPPLQAAADVTPGARQSDTEQTLRWVNDYTEMALLYDRYFQFGGAYSPKEMSWSVQDRAVLDSELQNADAAARRGIRAAQITGVDTGVLELVYERASALRSSRLDSGRMEALRQYWRCSLLGNMAWQLAAIPKAEALPPQIRPPAPQLAVTEAAEAADAQPAAETILAAIAVVPVHPSAPGAPGAPAPLPEMPESPVPPANAVTNNPNLDPHPIPVALTADADENSSVRRAVAVSYAY